MENNEIKPIETVQVTAKDGKIYQALTNILADIEPVIKNKKARVDRNDPEKTYNYRSVDDVINMLHNVFAKHKVVIIPNVLNMEIKQQDKAMMTVIDMMYQFVADDGSYVSVKTKSYSSDFSDKGFLKAMSYALKNMLSQMFLIPSSNGNDEHTTYNGNNISIKDVLQEIKNAKTTKELMIVYEKYPEYRESLKHYFTQRKEEIEKQNAKKQ